MGTGVGTNAIKVDVGVGVGVTTWQIQLVELTHDGFLQLPVFDPDVMLHIKPVGQFALFVQVSLHCGTGVGDGLGVGLGLGVITGVGLGLGDGVGDGLGLGVGLAVGVGVAQTQFTALVQEAFLQKPLVFPVAILQIKPVGH